jgi:hypothetical protein
VQQTINDEKQLIVISCSYEVLNDALFYNLVKCYIVLSYQLFSNSTCNRCVSLVVW